jgi:DNA-directed RNA polymerase subunit RPC12/RpoP
LVFKPRFGEEWICLRCSRLFDEDPGGTCPQCGGAVCVRLKMRGLRDDVWQRLHREDLGSLAFEESVLYMWKTSEI